MSKPTRRLIKFSRGTMAGQFRYISGGAPQSKGAAACVKYAAASAQPNSPNSTSAPQSMRSPGAAIETSTAASCLDRQRLADAELAAVQRLTAQAAFTSKARPQPTLAAASRANWQAGRADVQAAFTAPLSASTILTNIVELPATFFQGLISRGPPR